MKKKKKKHGVWYPRLILLKPGVRTMEWGGYGPQTQTMGQPVRNQDDRLGKKSRGARAQRQKKSLVGWGIKKKKTKRKQPPQSDTKHCGTGDSAGGNTGENKKNALRRAERNRGVEKPWPKSKPQVCPLVVEEEKEEWNKKNQKAENPNTKKVRRGYLKKRQLSRWAS